MILLKTYLLIFVAFAIAAPTTLDEEPAVTSTLVARGKPAGWTGPPPPWVKNMMSGKSSGQQQPSQPPAASPSQPQASSDSTPSDPSAPPAKPNTGSKGKPGGKGGNGGSGDSRQPQQPNSSSQPQQPAASGDKTNSNSNSQPQQPQSSSGGGGSGYMSVVASWRSKMGLPAFSQDSKLEANAQDTSASSGGKLTHKLNSGSMGQVMAPGSASNFESVFVGGWLCELPSLPGLGSSTCSTMSKGWNHAGQTGHAELLSSTKYKKIGCALATGIWTCDLA